MAGAPWRKWFRPYLPRTRPLPDMPGFQRLSIQSKMILLLLGVSLVSILVVAWIGYRSGREALLQSVSAKLQGVQVAKSTTVGTMLSSLRDQVISMSD
ncbi:MAG: hypothetical protein KGR69_12820, partial [Verrucomicrobia bacterium]|nr:hypothetical protein [Verrucomicrobiota bacterium]